MAINPKVIQRLKSQLLTSGLSQKDMPLFQVIDQLIDSLKAVGDEVVSISGGGGGGGGGGTPGAKGDIGPFLSGLECNEDTPLVIPGPQGIQGIQGPPGPFLFPEDGMPGMDSFIPGRNGLNGKEGILFALLEACCEGLSNPYPFGPPNPDFPIYTLTTTGTIDDLDFGNARTILFNNATDATLDGLKAGYDGQVVDIVCKGNGIVYLAHQNAGSLAANRLINMITSGVTPMAAVRGSCSYIYDLAAARWKLFRHNQGSYITIPFVAGDFTGNGAMTWTVAAGDIAGDSYMIVGRQYNATFRYNTTDVGGVLNTILQRLLPNGYTFGAAFNGVNFGTQGAGNFPTLSFNAAATILGQAILAGGAWAASAGTTQIAGSVAFPVT